MSLTVCLSALYAGRMQMSMAERQFQALVFLIPAFNKMNKNDTRKLLTITDAADKINQKILRHKDECSFDKDKEATDMLPAAEPTRRILFIHGECQTPADLTPFLKEQPQLQLLETGSVQEAQKLMQDCSPALVIFQQDAPNLQQLRTCVSMAGSGGTIFLLLVRLSTYEAVWSFVQRAGICVMSWPTSPVILQQMLRNLLLLKRNLQSMQEKTDRLQLQLQDLKRIQKAKSLLMRQLGMSEEDAHRWIEKAAMDRCVKKREIAETVIRMYEL